MSIIGDILDVAEKRLRRSDLINAVSRPDRDGDYDKDHNTVCLTHESPEVNEELSQVGNPPKIAFDFVMRVAGHIRQEKDDDSPIDDLLSDLAEDIMNTLTNDADGDPDPTWYSFGGNAINSGFGGFEKTGDDDDATCGVSVPVLITYRVFETKPQTLAG